MAIKKVRKEVWKGIAAIALALLVILALATPVAQSYEGRINTALGISTTQIVENEE
ncbi:MAG: hypothetical protein ACOYJL_03755 [Tractidigestivibacter sp.]|uniref:hypothetical protein n=1 Tax=Tractidigestivibacter sp. TaxID=2847320 RepID=UPI003D92DCE0